MVHPEELEQLEERLLDLDEEAMLASELDGFLAGILVCPEPITPEEWLPLALGQTADGPAVLADGNAVRETVRLIFRHYNALARDLQRGRYEPLFEIDDRNGDVLWELWADGFQHAVMHHPDAWRAIAENAEDKDASQALRGLTVLGAIATHDGRDGPKPAQAEELTAIAHELIPGWIATLHRWRMRNRTDRPPSVAPTKIGRNDPCPCGSGKKYKKCCGLN